MSELRSAVEALRAEALADLPDARIEDDFAELQRVGELLEMERLRRLAEIDRRRLFERDGHLSAASWLAARFGVGWGEARQHARVARALDDMPATRRALEAGDVSMSAVRVLATPARWTHRRSAEPRNSWWMRRVSTRSPASGASSRCGVSASSGNAQRTARRGAERCAVSTRP